MDKSILNLEPFSDAHANTYRTIFKTRHGRVLFLSVLITDEVCTITDCFYTDRNFSKLDGKYNSVKPKKLQTFQFPLSELISVIASELDKQFYGVEFVQSKYADLPTESYIEKRLKSANSKYKFLIMVGSGEIHNGLPFCLCTRLKNNLHRSIFLELSYYKDGTGLVKHCYYYDRQYKRKGIHIVPPMLISCFFPYTREGILNLLNHEICCDFTHMIITDGLDLDSNTTPLCGAL